jgi:hypothetical protein
MKRIDYRTLVPLVSVALIFFGCNGAEPSPQSVVVTDQGLTASAMAMRADVLWLTDERFEGRETGQPGAYAA